MIRQGDILIVPTNEKPRLKGRKYHKPVADLGLVVAEGEATGHHHKITTEGVKMFERNGTLYLDVPETGANLTHEEHATLKLTPGRHKVVRQREYVGPREARQAPRTRNVWD